MFAVSLLGHSLAQFVERQEVLLIGCQEAVDALAGPRQVPQQGSLALLRRVGCPRRCQPAVELVLDQARILQQADDLGPDNLIEEILADRAVIADRAAEPPPGVRADAAVVVDVAGARPGRRARQGVAALAARHPARRSV